MKILQWNVWYKEDVQNILKTLREVDADVLCLQELTVNYPTVGVDIPGLIAGLGYERVYKESETEVADGVARSFGNGIFSKYSIVSSRFVYVQDPPQEKTSDYSKEARVYVEAEVNGYTVGTVHMSYTDRFIETPEKRAEADRLFEIVKEKKQNYILTGDFNAAPDSYTIDGVGKCLKNAGPDFSAKTWTTKPFSYQGFDATTLDWRLDYCFVSPDVQVKSAQIVDTPASDHLPILIEI